MFHNFILGFLLEPFVICFLLGSFDFARAKLLEVVRGSGDALLGRKGIQDCKERVRGNLGSSKLNSIPFSLQIEAN
jgi:hypothetical protein